jgi:predicted transcriptional regulator
MPSLEQIRASIEARLAELSNELTALEDARASLHGERSASSTTGAPTNGAAAASKRHRTPTRARSQPNGAKKPRNRSSAEAVPEAPATPPSAAVTPPLSLRARTPAKRAKVVQAADSLVADTLGTILHGEGDGLSAATIAERSNARYGQVLNLLRELESAGQVRRTGTRRSTRWRLITDGERIAERAAELASRMAKSGS